MAQQTIIFLGTEKYDRFFTKASFMVNNLEKLRDLQYSSMRDSLQRRKAVL